MKYVVILGDGMADKPVPELGYKTPLEVAHKPNIDSLAQKGICGMAITVPNGLKPGSDVANLSVMGYSPLIYYSGRSPLEALSIGVDMAMDDLAVRCNLVTLSDEENYADKTMVDYSAGEISTEEAKELINTIQEKLGSDIEQFYNGVSYRHCLIRHHSKKGTDYTPPHDISGKVIGSYLPSGLYGEEMLDLMVKSYDILKDHPVNLKRIEAGKNPANSIWLWGEGTRPMLPSFEELRGLKGAVISAVDLLKGIGIAGDMDVIEVEGATGTVDTNFDGKAKACVKAIKDGYDYVYLHMEAPDECGHQGDVQGKVRAIELIDEKVVGYILEQLKDEDLRILISPDHPTPLITKTHCSDPIPFVIYDSTVINDGISTYTEKECEKTGLFLNSGDELVDLFLHKGEDMSRDNQNQDSNVIDLQNLDSSNAVVVGEQVEQAVNEEELNTAENEQVDSNFDESNTDIVDEKMVQETEGGEDENNLSNDDQVEDNNNNDKKGKKNKKDKKPMNPKQKKIVIISTAVLATILIILTAVLTPILVINAPKIIIKSAEDFSKPVKDSKDLYYLEKDVICNGDLTLGLNVDLNDKTLTVNGNLTIVNPKNGELNIGSVEKKMYELGGKIVAKKLVIKSAKKLNLSTNVVADEVVFENITQGEVLGSLQVQKAMEVKGANLQINQTAFGESVTAIKATNSKLTFNKEVKNKLELLNSSAIAKTDIGNSVLDENSEIRVNGAVYADFVTKKLGTITGGKLVYVSENGAFDQIIGAKEVWLDAHNNKNGDLIGMKDGTIHYVKILATPKKATIERKNSDINLTLSNVDKDATQIVLTIDDKEPIELEKNAENKYKLTEHLNKVGTHHIKILLRSSEPEFIRDSEAYYIDYEHKLKLEGVSDAKVTFENGKYVLRFKAVDNADSYEIMFDGVKYTIKSDKKAGEEIVDILSDRTEIKDMLTPGSHLLTIVAKNSKQDGIEPSDEVIAEFDVIPGVLGKITLTYEIKDNQIIFSWNNLDKAIRYELYQVNADGNVMIVNTKKTNFAMEYNDSLKGAKFFIKAIGDENYNPSQSEQITLA